MKTYQAIKPKSYWLMVDRVKAHNKLQELKRIDKKRKLIKTIQEITFVVCLLACTYLLLLIGSI